MNVEKANGFAHSLVLCAVVGLIMLEAHFFNLSDPTWAIISAVVCTELEIDQARSLIFGRILATLLGIVLTIIIIMILGRGYLAVLVGIMVITLVGQYIAHLGINWKVATATGGIILVSNLHQQSLKAAENVAYERAIEVAIGSLTAGVVSIIFGKLWQFVKSKYNSPP